MKPTLITYKGKTQSLTAWGREYGLTSGAINNRIRAGWEIERALNTPATDNSVLYTYNGKQYTAYELAKMHGNIDVSSMRMRLKKMSVEEAVTTPNKHVTRKKRITAEKQKMVCKPITRKPDTKRCRSCIYHGTLGGGEKGEIYCDYIEIEFHRRPCKPGPNCTAYKKGKSIVRKTALKRMGKVNE